MLNALQPLLKTIPIDQLVFVAMLVFARVGFCFMLMPGIGTARIPIRQRLFLAIAFTFATLPFIGSELLIITRNLDPAHLLLSLFSESLIGASFGISAHIFIWTLQFMAALIGLTIGYSGQPGRGVIESTPETPLTNFLTLVGLMVFFAADLHLQVIRGLLNSYTLVPAAFMPRPEAALIDYRDAISKVFLTLTHISAPFLVYSILVNFSVGLINKMIPNIQVYFISVPFIMVGGLFLLYFLLPEIFSFFTEEMRSFIE